MDDVVAEELRKQTEWQHDLMNALNNRLIRLENSVDMMGLEIKAIKRWLRGEPR